MAERPSEIPVRRTRFDDFAEHASEVVGRAAFFIGAMLLVVVWIPTVLVFRSADTWQLVISTITSVMAFLLVALLQNSERRSDVALHRKLDAIAEALAAVMDERLEAGSNSSEAGDPHGANGAGGPAPAEARRRSASMMRSVHEL